MTDATTGPLVHLNGTSADSLIEANTDAAEAVTKALDALCDAAPNARDYYPLAPGAFEVARREHVQRIEALRAVHEALVAIVMNVQDQANARKRDR